MTTLMDDLLEYYNRELTYLRRAGTAFAEQYPKVAGRLEIGAGPCPDPHIERLLESFAFLTARIQHRLEGEFPELATALLGTVYPHFLSPVPSMTVARFDVDPTQGKLTTGHRIPAHTPLFAQTETYDHCFFRTAYPVVLWPLEISEAAFESTEKYDFLDDMPQVALVLRLSLVSPGAELGPMGLDRLRFYLNADRMLANSLYELLFAHVLDVALLPEDRLRPVHLGAEAVRPVGFGADESVLDYPAHVHRGYRLLHEYFTFPEKFLFFDVEGLQRHGSESSFDLLFLLSQLPDARLTIDRTNFCLGCTPIINLFGQTTEPIRVDERRSEYLLQPDLRREAISEIHSLVSVHGTDDENLLRTFQPYFSYTHELERRDQRAFWVARREPSGRPQTPGTQIQLSFVDLDFNPARPPTTTVFARTLCTNRRLAEELPAGAVLQLEQAAPLARIIALHKPTAQLDPPLGGRALWRLISHLSLNYLSLSSTPAALKALREILRLYSFTDPEQTWQQVNGIRAMACQRVTRRLGQEGWRGFCRGIEVTLTFDERMYVGSGAFLLGAVLQHFFPLYASINTFTQLVIESQQREGVWKRWPPVVGEQPVL